jgi:hypothetical protein
MPFEYSKSGLPANDVWEKATSLCNAWLDQNMSMFGPERIESFMMHQPVAAAKLIIGNCPDYSEESVILALLGPAKGELLSNGPQMTAALTQIFGEPAVELLKYMSGMTEASDLSMPRDANRLFLVEGLSTMNDQLIGRARIDKHHQTRWNILKNLELNFSKVKGQNPGIDKIFAEALVKSRQALEALDNAPKKPGPKPPTP